MNIDWLISLAILGRHLVLLPIQFRRCGTGWEAVSFAVIMVGHLRSAERREYIFSSSLSTNLDERSGTSRSHFRALSVFLGNAGLSRAPIKSNARRFISKRRWLHSSFLARRVARNEPLFSRCYLPGVHEIGLRITQPTFHFFTCFRTSFGFIFYRRIGRVMFGKPPNGSAVSKRKQMYVYIHSREKLIKR